VTRLRAILTAWWFLPLLLLLAGLWLAWQLNAGRESEATARRLADEARLRAEGILVVEQAKGRDLEAEARRLGARVPELEAELERARKAAPGARVTGTVSTSTGGVVAGGSPRPGPACPAAAPPAAAPAPPSGPPAPACVLADGDVGEIRVDQVAMETREGAQLLVGSTSAWRLDPGPATKVMSGSFRSALSTAKTEPPPAPPGWGAGLYAGVSREGWALGPALALPPARLWALQLEVVLGAGVGPGGVWTGAGTALARW
jgi:hypothetical protein